MLFTILLNTVYAAAEASPAESGVTTEFQADSLDFLLTEGNCPQVCSSTELEELFKNICKLPKRALVGIVGRANGAQCGVSEVTEALYGDQVNLNKEKVLGKHYYTLDINSGENEYKKNPHVEWDAARGKFNSRFHLLYLELFPAVLTVGEGSMYHLLTEDGLKNPAIKNIVDHLTPGGIFMWEINLRTVVAKLGAYEERMQVNPFILNATFEKLLAEFFPDENGPYQLNGKSDLDQSFDCAKKILMDDVRKEDEYNEERQNLLNTVQIWRKSINKANLMEEAPKMPGAMHGIIDNFINSSSFGYLTFSSYFMFQQFPHMKEYLKKLGLKNINATLFTGKNPINDRRNTWIITAEKGQEEGL